MHTPTMQTPSGERPLTYSINIFLPLTRACANRCAYCGFRRDEADLLPLERIRLLCEEAAREGATEALFTFGDHPMKATVHRELTYLLDGEGYVSFIAYIRRACEIAIDCGLLPHTNAGVLSKREMRYLAPFNVSMGLMLEEMAELDVHAESPYKRPATRLKVLRYAGQLDIPFTTGLLVGIGEERESRIESIERIADLHNQFGHIQEVIIQGFTPKSGTPMHSHPPASLELLEDTIKLAREILPPDVPVQVPPNLVPLHSLSTLVRAGATDFGGISAITMDHVNPEAPWPTIYELSSALPGYTIRERLPIHPTYVKKGWYSPYVEPLIRKLSSPDGFRLK
ncbi:MAG: 7,8-didemethyl-8-hydroxy-5-deazariboflavin synthase subunit CofG [Methermicoccaceae archaeon]